MIYDRAEPSPSLSPPIAIGSSLPRHGFHLSHLPFRYNPNPNPDPNVPFRRRPPPPRCSSSTTRKPTTVVLGSGPSGMHVRKTRYLTSPIDSFHVPDFDLSPKSHPRSDLAPLYCFPPIPTHARTRIPPFGLMPRVSISLV